MHPDSTSLQALIAATARGDHAAFAAVYERTHAHLFGIALRMLGREQAAEDVLQEAFVSIWKNAGSYRAEIGGQALQPMTWLIAIVRNKSLDALRARKRLAETALPGTDAGDTEGGQAAGPGHDATSATSPTSPSAMELLAQAGDALRIRACLEALDGSHRQSLALAYYQGLTHAEVAERMGAPLGSVKAWIRRGLDKLKTCLAGAGLAS